MKSAKKNSPSAGKYPRKATGLIKERARLLKRLRELDTQQIASYIQPAYALLPPQWTCFP